MSPVIETRRLRLRVPTLADAGAIAEGVGAYSVARYLTVVPHPYEPRMAAEWIATLPSEPTPDRAAFLVELAGRGVIGCVTIMDKLGFWIAQPFWGQGFVTEAAGALVHWHFAGSDEPVRCGAHWDNKASLAVQKKLGFTEIGRTLRFVISQNRHIEHIDTRLTRPAYEARR